MYRLLFLTLFLTMLGGVFFPAYSSAAEPKKIGQFSYWTVHKMKQGRFPVCYMSITANPPKSNKKSKHKRGDVVLMITHRPVDGAQDVVSYSVGGRLRASSSVYAILGDKRFDLFTHDNAAWARDASADHELSMALRAGTHVTFMGRLATGRKFADTVNLKGSAKAYEMMSKACGVQILSIPASARPKYPNPKKR